MVVRNHRAAELPFLNHALFLDFAYLWADCHLLFFAVVKKRKKRKRFEWWREVCFSLVDGFLCPALCLHPSCRSGLSCCLWDGCRLAASRCTPPNLTKNNGSMQEERHRDRKYEWTKRGLCSSSEQTMKTCELLWIFKVKQKLKWVIAPSFCFY